jgi:hypothetical protein
MQPDSLAAWAMPIRPLWLLSSGSFSHDLSPRKIMTMHFPGTFGIQKVLKYQIHGKREFSSSQKLNATNRDFVRKSHKSSKICKKNNNITMQITFQYDNMN